jgi:hypothetical protein
VTFAKCSGRKWFCFTEVDELVLDPIIRVLTFAVADRAFVNNITSVADLFRLRPAKAKKHLELRWHSSKLDTPIFREPANTVNGRETSPTKGLTYATHRRNANRLGEHAGFDLIFNVYSTRRGAGNAVESKSPKRFSSRGRNTDSI